MSPLHSEEQQALLDAARQAISAVVTGGRPLEAIAPTGNVAVPGGAFVTLRRRGRLCGCIGLLSSFDRLVDVVAHCAVAAATDDPRFPPLRTDDLEDLEIEISVLSPAEAARPEQVEPGVHGLVVSLGGRRGVLLPQVAIEHRWSRERFLEETCHKAGLAADAWKDPETCVEIFTAEIFSDSGRDGGRMKSGAHEAEKRGGYSSSQ